MYYSHSTKGFYDPAIHGDAIPADAVEISSALHAELLAGQALGKRIASSPGAPPHLADQPQPTSEEVRALKWEAVKAERDRLATTGGYKVGDKWFHSDQRSQTQQLALARKADRVEAAGGSMTAPFDGNSGQWKTMDGSFVAMTPALAQAIAAAAEQQEGALFVAAETHRAALMASPDPAAYDFSGGWPPVYPGA